MGRDGESLFLHDNRHASILGRVRCGLGWRGIHSRLPYNDARDLSPLVRAEYDDRISDGGGKDSRP